jgi:hypothetical protein
VLFAHQAPVAVDAVHGRGVGWGGGEVVEERVAVSRKEG